MKATHSKSIFQKQTRMLGEATWESVKSPQPYCTFRCRLQTVIKQKDARTTHTHTHIKAHIVIIILYVPFFCARLHARRAAQSKREKKVTLVIIRRSDAVWMMMCYSGPRVTSTNINTSRREASAHRMWTTAAERYYMRERGSLLSLRFIFIKKCTHAAAQTMRRRKGSPWGDCRRYIADSMADRCPHTTRTKQS